MLNLSNHFKPKKTNYINRIVTFTDKLIGWLTVKRQQGFIDLRKIDNINQMITVSVITLSSAQCITKHCLHPFERY